MRNNKMNKRTRLLALTICLLPALAQAAGKSDLVMFGGDASRNFVSDEKNLPVEWDLKSGKNIKWVAELGSLSPSEATLAVEIAKTQTDHN